MEKNIERLTVRTQQFFVERAWINPGYVIPGIWLRFNAPCGDTDGIVGPYGSKEEAYLNIKSAETHVYSGRGRSEFSISLGYKETYGVYPTFEELVEFSIMDDGTKLIQILEVAEMEKPVEEP